MIDIGNRAYFNNLLMQYDYLLKQYESELKKLPEGELGIRTSGEKGSYQYCHYLNGKRIGITKREDLVKALTRKKYLKKAIKAIEQNMKYLKILISNYEAVDQTEIISGFPHYYATLMNREQTEWNMRKYQWMLQEYDQSTFRPWEKTQVTANGLHVRSKSEVIIAERLDYYGIPYRYEEMIYIEQYRLAPDFTIFTKDGLKYWEHCGRMDDPGYIGKQNWKNSMYAKVNIVPWKNYIITYDDEKGNFDSRIIEYEIINKLLPYC